MYYLMQELASIIAGEQRLEKDDKSLSNDVNRLVWDASTILSDSRPPSSFCVYDRSGAKSPLPGKEQVPPIFDGSVANATPPPLGGAASGASGGSGTILHLACAMDLPLILAFLLCMGADGRASHTAFRRLMIHEAACNGSIQCLQLLLEMGHKFAASSENKKREPVVPFFPDSFELSASTSNASSLSRFSPPISMNMRYFRKDISSNLTNRGNFLAMLRLFQNCHMSVQKGEMTELQAARTLMNEASLSDATRTSLIRSCAFKTNSYAPRSFLRPHGSADGHGNTPLHWAAFKNETKCVSLLLEYNADPNARAHPSGWTPLHDAAYSNSGESIELLVSKGAKVDARANSGATPLCFAAQEDAARAAKLLLDRGADLTSRCAGAPRDGTAHPNTPNHPHSRFSGYTPLHYCAHYNARRAARVLLRDSNARNGMETADLSGRLPIHVAVARGSSDVLRELLHAGARVDIRPGGSGTSPTSSSSPSSRALTAASNPPALLGALPQTPPRRFAPSESYGSPGRSQSFSSATSSTSGSPVTSPLLRSMIPTQPIKSTKPWNCLTQQAIDECRDLIAKAERSWSPDLHLLFTPQDRKAVMELLRVGKRLEQQGTGIFVDLWPLVLGFCGRGWFEVEKPSQVAIECDDTSMEIPEDEEFDDYLALPTLGSS
eukprot:scaffold1136_cov146-Cylindrotheca_fusiformis.AAC.4